MSTAEYINMVENCIVKEERVKAIEKKYKTILEPVVKQIISFADMIDFFDEERRALSYSEIYNPEKNLGFDFIKEGLLPFVDLYDNSYAVFIVETKEWGRFNTSDGILYKKRKSMEEVL